jgi:sulfoxide reductase catalytic subunit YedY
MLIRIPKGWELPEREATPEHVYWNRRQLLAAAGFAAGAPLLRGAGEPPKRNPKFTLDRPITEEWAATSRKSRKPSKTTSASSKFRLGRSK